MSNKRFGESGYQRKLRDPRWQKKRLELLAKADWKCQEPGCRRWIFQHTEHVHIPPDVEAPSLEIHHLYYEWGRDPWEYPDDAFLVLCDECHEERQAIERHIKKELVKMLRSVPAPILEDIFGEMIEAKFGRKPDRLTPEKTDHEAHAA